MLVGGWGRLPKHGSNVGVHATAFGWPRRALWSYIEHKESGAVARGGSVLIGQHGRPFLPIPSGFLLDTLFYAAPWWLILITLGWGGAAIRRFQRRRRGRCIHCGYDLAGLPGGTVPGGTVLRTVIDEDAGGTGAHEDTARRAVPPTCPECGSANT